MAAAVPLLFPAQSKRPAEPSAETAVLDLCMLSAEGSCAEAPLTSEPPLPDLEPLTSEPPLADAAPLTSEPSVAGAGLTGACADPSGL
ncbi:MULTISPECIES: hypothetical protein [unclassified Streptomyces]|uniref:hypothetical protein n=1 Tax=unclassified Streptomyces TaxID=2593676 RepID=UPI0004C24A11|nr:MULTISPECIES: hypothetical protein [unclassified Streptomyces]